MKICLWYSSITVLGDSRFVLQEKDYLLFFSFNEKFMLTAISLKVGVKQDEDSNNALFAFSTDKFRPF